MRNHTRQSRRRACAGVCLFSLLMIVSAARAGVDVKVNQDPPGSLQNETSITINRGLSGNVVVGYNDMPGAAIGLGISYSFNSGATWNDAQTASVWGIEADPALASDLAGNLFAAMISYSGAGPLIYPNNGIYVSRSTDGGMTWGVPTMVDQYLAGAVPAYFTDKDYIATDTYAGSPYANNVYVVWQRDNANGVNADIFFAWSNDQAASFNYATGTPAGRISDLPSVPGTKPPVRASNANGAVPAVAPDGTVYVAWQDAPLCIQSTGQIFVDKSTDGGQTWGSDVVASTYNTCARYPKGGISFQVRSFPSIAVCPVPIAPGTYDVYVVYSADPDRWNEVSIESDAPGANPSEDVQLACSGPSVYAAWVDKRNSANGDIYFSRSSDNGVSWKPDVRLNTGVTAGSAFVQTPRIATDLNFVYVVWEDRRNGNPDIYYNQSADFGATWMASAVRLDTGTTAGADNSWAPEIAAMGGNVYVVWLDDRNGDSDVFSNYSNNTGGTWQGAALRVDNAPGGVWSNAPQIACQGTDVYATWWDARSGSDRIYFNSSSTGGATWQASDTSIDTGSGPCSYPRICAFGSYVYVAWTDQRNGASDIYFNSSANQGVGWQASDTRLDVGDLPGAAPSGELEITCSGNAVYAVWSDSRNGQTDIYYNVSTNNGATWLAGDVRIDADYIPGGNASSAPCLSAQGNHVYIAYADVRHGVADIYYRHSVNYGINSWYNYDIRLDAGDVAGANPSGSPALASSGSYVHAAWLDSRNGNGDVYSASSANYGVSFNDGPDDGDIMLVRSSNNGLTWGAPVRVNSDVGTSGQFQPWIKIKPNGIIDVVWYDRRNDTVNDSFVEVYLGTSNDRGMTFTNAVVSDVVLPPGAPPAIWPWPWIGEYVGIDVDQTDAYIVWTDTRTYDLDIYFDRFANPLTVGVGDDVPRNTGTWLAQNVPNPFNPLTTISFGLDQRGDVSLRIYDVSGRLLRVLVDGVRRPGQYDETWDGRDRNGNAVSSGVYFYRLIAPGFDETRKMVLLR